MAVVWACGMVRPASAQLSFITGVDPAANPNGAYDAGLFYNFSDSGGTGGISAGTPAKLYPGSAPVWTQQVWDFAFTYNPMGFVQATITTPGGPVYGSGVALGPPSLPVTEVQLTQLNTGLAGLILSISSLNSVANGGVFLNAGYGAVAGGAENFAPGNAWTAAYSGTLQAYLDSPTLLRSGFTLNGTITLSGSANSITYGDNLDSLIEFNLASTPEPATWALMAGGAGLLGVFRRRHKR